MFRSSLDTVFDRMLTLSRAMDEAVSQGQFESTDTPARPQLWLPPVDIYETESAFVVEADLGGYAFATVGLVEGPRELLAGDERVKIHVAAD